MLKERKKIMKKLICIFLAGAMLMLAGCSGGGDASDTSAPQQEAEETTTTTTTTPPLTADPNLPADHGSIFEFDVEMEATVTMIEPFGNNPAISTKDYPIIEPKEDMSAEEQYQLMIDNSLMTLGDTSRMVKVLQKAAAGEEITVGFIGGSITEGLSAGPEQCWARLTYEALCEMYPNTKINYVNAGLSGTNSALGIVRAERDLCSEHVPDIVFIEFAVNNGGEQMDKDSYESLVRKFLEKDNDPAVVLLFTVLKNEYTAQPWMTMVGEHYDLPMISVGNAINPMFKAKLMEWEKYSDDESHPNYWGHELLRDFNMNYFKQVKEIADGGNAPELKALPEEAVYSYAYKNMQLLERDQMHAISEGDFKEMDTIVAGFNNGWTKRSKNEAAVYFNAEFKTLMLVFHCNNTDSFADAEVYIDGELVNTVSSNRPGGWGNPEAYLAWSTEEDAASHEVAIVIPDSDSANYYGLLGVGISR